MVCQTTSEISIKGLTVKYAESINSRSALQVLSVSVKIVQKIAKRESYFWNFNSNLELIAFLYLRFEETHGNLYVQNKDGMSRIKMGLYCVY